MARVKRELDIWRAMQIAGRPAAPNPGSAEALLVKGNAQAKLGRHEQALASYEKAISIKPDHAIAWNSHGLALQALNRHEDAVASFDRGLAIKPDFAEALNNRANSLGHLGRSQEA